MKIATGIASTTHIDAHGERMAKQALDGAAEQIRSRFIPFLVDHDPNQQIGVLIYGQVEQLEDGEFALFVVFGIFDDEEEGQRFAVGAANTVWQDYVHYLDGIRAEAGRHKVSDRKQGSDENHKGDPRNIADLLETYLDSTAIWVDGRVYKVKHLIAATGDLSIHVYPKDHDPAHFHVVSKQRGIDARFDIFTLEPMTMKKGLVRSSDVKKIQEFFRQRPDKLKEMRDEHARMK
jgi:hypothetical protein